MSFAGRLLRYVRRHHIGLAALFVALTGTAYAASLPRNSVGPSQLKPNAVRGADAKESTFSRVPKATQAKNASALSGNRITTQTVKHTYGPLTGSPLELVCPNDGLAVHGSESASPPILNFTLQNYGPFMQDPDRSGYSVGVSNPSATTSATATVRLTCLGP